mmetsp:Transcript_147746/g.271651  ORF Transcript_147746/g.271651 Transcript_147746/m.271651 type:complete len:282 (-) Transcript_147746:138-983(-)
MSLRSSPELTEKNKLARLAFDVGLVAAKGSVEGNPLWQLLLLCVFRRHLNPLEFHALWHKSMRQRCAVQSGFGLRYDDRRSTVGYITLSLCPAGWNVHAIHAHKILPEHLLKRESHPHTRIQQLSIGSLYIKSDFARHVSHSMGFSVNNFFVSYDLPNTMVMRKLNFMESAASFESELSDCIEVQGSIKNGLNQVAAIWPAPQLTQALVSTLPSARIVFLHSKAIDQQSPLPHAILIPQLQQRASWPCVDEVTLASCLQHTINEDLLTWKAQLMHKALVNT